MKFDVGHMRERWASVGQAFNDVADSCQPHMTPMDTATALRAAAENLVALADEYERMISGE